MSSDDNVLMVMDLDLKEHSFRKVQPGDSDDESEGFDVIYHDKENLIDTD